MSNINAGRGGSYVLDPETGDLELIQRTSDPAYDVLPEPTQAQPVNADSTDTQASADPDAEA